MCEPYKFPDRYWDFIIDVTKSSSVLDFRIGISTVYTNKERRSLKREILSIKDRLGGNLSVSLQEDHWKLYWSVSYTSQYVKIMSILDENYVDVINDIRDKFITTNDPNGYDYEHTLLVGKFTGTSCTIEELVLYFNLNSINVILVDML